MASQLDSSLTNSNTLAPWKRGQVPAHWPDFAADREAPPMHEVLVSSESPEDDDEDELSDDDLELDDDRVRGVLVTEPAAVARDYVPALLERTRGVFKRTATNVLIPIGAIAILVLSMGGTWSTADATPAPQWSATAPPGAPRTTAPARTAIEIDEPDHPAHAKSGRKDLAGKLNLNTASEDQLMILPSVGPSKAERIVTWRKKNGGFKRTADLRRVKGFGYKTFKKLEPFLDIKGDTTLAAK